MSHATSCSYDELPYEDLAFYLTHPSNLAVVATLCGLEPPPVANCRVLELGCGTGFNLLAMAQSLPAARFVGVDLSARQIEQGRATAAAVGCDRIDLHARDVADLDDSFGLFDYVIAHGLFSWVPEPVRRAILPLCKRLLAPNGIAYVSYNTYPGWHQRTILRDVMRFHAPAGVPPLEQARRGRAGLEQLLGALPDPDTHYGRFLRAEVESLRRDSDVYLFHEFLETDNQPLRFEEFARMASASGLRFLAEARFGTNSFAQGSEVQQALDAVSDDLLRREQHLDFLRNRFFRQSLTCHAEVRPSWAPSLQGVSRLRVLCRVEPLDVGPVGVGGSERFRLDGQKVLDTEDPVLRGMLHRLRAVWPRPVSVAELAAGVAETVGPAEFPPGLPPELLVGPRVVRGYADGLWQLFAYDPPFVTAAGERPQACPLARWQAERTGEVTSRLHRPVRLAEPDRAVLRRLDGQTTREQLASDLPGGAAAVGESLRRLAESSLLVG
jgi:SAM-dependent methyltransferase